VCIIPPASRRGEVLGFGFSFVTRQRFTASSEHPKMLRAFLTEVSVYSSGL
jgi:hypothetical protein